MNGVNTVLYKLNKVSQVKVWSHGAPVAKRKT